MLCLLRVLGLSAAPPASDSAQITTAAASPFAGTANRSAAPNIPLTFRPSVGWITVERGRDPVGLVEGRVVLVTGGAGGMGRAGAGRFAARGGAPVYVADPNVAGGLGNGGRLAARGPGPRVGGRPRQVL